MNPGRLNVIKNWRSNPHAIDKFQFVYNFLPHPEEKRRAKLLSPGAFAVYCLIIVLTVSIVRFVPKIFPGVLGYASNINVKDLLTLTNQKREGAGLADLRLNPQLTKAAEDKAKDMFTYNYWAHVSPNGAEPWDFILKEGYNYTYAGENLAKNFSTSREIVSAWFASQSHKENLLNKNYDEIGFAVVNGVLDGYETTLVVQMFGRPQSPTQLATKYDEQKLLETAVQAQPAQALGRNVATVKPVVDVKRVTKSLSLFLGGFVALLFLLDIWYSRRKAILKFTGHTFAHLMFLAVVILSIWFVLVPGVIM